MLLNELSSSTSSVLRYHNGCNILANDNRREEKKQTSPLNTKLTLENVTWYEDWKRFVQDKLKIFLKI